MLTPEQRGHWDDYVTEMRILWGDSSAAEFANDDNQWEFAVLAVDAHLAQLEVEVARLRPIVEAACAYRPQLYNVEEFEVDPSSVYYDRWREMADFVRAVDAYRATEATT